MINDTNIMKGGKVCTQIRVSFQNSLHLVHLVYIALIIKKALSNGEHAPIQISWWTFVSTFKIFIERYLPLVKITLECNWFLQSTLKNLRDMLSYTFPLHFWCLLCFMIKHLHLILFLFHVLLNWQVNCFSRCYLFLFIF